MKTLRVVGMHPMGLPAFSWMVRIGAPLLMRTDPELALYGRYVVSKRLQQEGYEFQFPHLENALRDLLRTPGNGNGCYRVSFVSQVGPADSGIQRRSRRDEAKVVRLAP